LFEISRDRLLLSPLNLTEIIVIIIWHYSTLINQRISYYKRWMKESINELRIGKVVEGSDRGLI
jgi:hypothetical protein